MVGSIGVGMVLLVGIGAHDGPGDVEALVGKVSGLRIFPDDDGRMNRSLLDIGGEALVVSQFTLLGDVSRGRRPSFTAAAEPGRAEEAIASVIEGLRMAGITVASGVFGARMEVELVNDGPVTVVLDLMGGKVLAP